MSLLAARSQTQAREDVRFDVQKITYPGRITRFAERNQVQRIAQSRSLEMLIDSGTMLWAICAELVCFGTTVAQVFRTSRRYLERGEAVVC